MKSKVVIENGETTIILTPENEFEIDLIEKIHCKKEKYNINTAINATYQFGDYQKHKIEISINECG